MDIFLRNLSLDDAKDFFYAAWDENVWRFIPGFYCDTRNKALEIIKGLLSAPDVTAYVIASKEISFIGLIVVVKKGIQEEKESFEISYFINDKYRRKGYATKAIRQILNDYKPCIIYLDIVSWNHASIALTKHFNTKKAKPDIYDNLYFIENT